MVYVIQSKDEMLLIDIKKKDRETLRNYLERFNVVDIIICQHDEWIVHIVVVFGINRKKEFYMELKKTQLQNSEIFTFR